MNSAMQKALDTENEIIGDLKDKFISKTDDFNIQTKKAYCVSDIIGAIALAYYRGKQVGQGESKTPIRLPDNETGWNVASLFGYNDQDVCDLLNEYESKLKSMNKEQFIPPGIIAFKAPLGIYEFPNIIHTYEQWVKQSLNQGDSIHTIEANGQRFSVGDRTKYGVINSLVWKNGWVANTDTGAIFRVLENLNAKLKVMNTEEYSNAPTGFKSSDGRDLNYPTTSDPYITPGPALQRLIAEYQKHGSLYIGFDFDGTVHDYHKKGYTFHNVINLLRDLKAINCKLICWTAYQNLDFVNNYLVEHRIPFDAINEGGVDMGYESKKPFFNALLDDRSGLDSVYRDLMLLVKHVKENS